MSLELRITLGAIAAVVIAVIARRARSLSGSGAAAAVVTGTVAAAAGWPWAILLVLYFVSSTLLSRLGRRRKFERTAGMVDKPGARDAWQVLSNGLAFMVAALAAIAWPHHLPLLEAAAAGSLAASAADTWATEVGTLVGQEPRSIITGRRLEIGQSGGVTWAGSLASLAGALFVGLAALAVGWQAAMLAGVVAAGLAGSVADSILGALAQRRSWCDACDAPTEMRVHTCGSPTRPAGGLSFMGNDLVNLLATVVGALTAALFSRGLA
jgi:uncharacterized protein (TIGR00297 family)